MADFLQHTLAAALRADPLTLAILFIGLISLGVIWLASLVIRGGKKK